VRDITGCGATGVTIEVSPGPHHRRSAAGVTDETGQYRSPDLPPGTYKVSFTLPSFATVVREGVELKGAGVMNHWCGDAGGSVSESVT